MNIRVIESVTKDVNSISMRNAFAINTRHSTRNTPLPTSECRAERVASSALSADAFCVFRFVPDNSARVIGHLLRPVGCAARLQTRLHVIGRHDGANRI
jgi:hypothetical protein